jgi:flagellar biosynthetic protein FliP
VSRTARPSVVRALAAAPLWRLLAALTLVVLGLVAFARPAAAQVAPPFTAPTIPQPGQDADEAEDAGTVDDDASISIDLGEEADGSPNQSVLIILLLTLLSVAPALLIMLTSFTRIVIVLSLTRNALGLQGIPPNQVLIGLALFLRLFVMSPTLKEINDTALQPLLKGEMEQGEAYDAAVVPIRSFMLSQTREGELSTFVAATSDERPDDEDDVSLAALVPAFILSELKTAFIIGFIVFIPFLVIDIVVSSSLMSMGMMMLPPSMVSLPFKLLLFVMVDGWGLITRSLLQSFG